MTVFALKAAVVTNIVVSPRRTNSATRRGLSSVSGSATTSRAPASSGAQISNVEASNATLDAMATESSGPSCR